jgi:hypothetical protein
MPPDPPVAAFKKRVIKCSYEISIPGKNVGNERREERWPWQMFLMRMGSCAKGDGRRE